MSVAVPLTNDDGAAAAAGLLYERHSTRIFSFCLRRLRSREEAEDAVQQTFLKAFGAMRGGFRPNAERAWLYRIAENVCADRARASIRRGRFEAADVDDLSEVLPAREAHPPIEGLDRALLELTPAQRQALLLREWQGMSYQEIASELRLSQSAVETLLFRARRSLARRLEDERTSLRSRLADMLAIAGWLKSALSGGVAAKTAVAVVAAGTVGAAAVAPLVAEHRRPFIPAPAQSIPHGPPATDNGSSRVIPPVASADRDPRTAVRERSLARPAPAEPGSERTTRPGDTPSSPTTPKVDSRPTASAPTAPPPASAPPDGTAPPAPPVSPAPLLPVTPPPLPAPVPQLPPVPELPAPNVQVPPVDDALAPVTDALEPVTDALPDVPSLP